MASPLEPERSDGAAPGAARTWAYRLVTATLLPVLVLALLEGALRLAGAGHPTAFALPCQVEGRRAWCSNDAFARPFFPPGAFRLPPPLVIPADKPPGTFRIFVVGESAAMGDPEPAYGLARYLEVILRRRHPGVRFEVFNTAVTAVNSHVLRRLVGDLSARQGDLFVFYAGNNEVVGYAGAETASGSWASRLPILRAGLAARATRLGQLVAAGLAPSGRAGPAGWRGMEMFLDQQVRAAQPGLARVHQHFERNLTDMVAVARAAGARVLVGTVASNLRMAPFASLHRPDLDAAALAAWEQRYRAGAEAEGARRWPEALLAYRAAAELDDTFAALAFRQARCHLALGEAEAARRDFARARDLDTLRFRADGAINEAARRVVAAAGPGVELVDGEAALAAASPDGLPGGELLWEHVHLTPEGNYLLARTFADRVAAMVPGGAAPALARDDPSQASCDEDLALTGRDRRAIAEDVLKRLARPPFVDQLDHQAQLATVRRRAEAPVEDPGTALAIYARALERRPGDALLRGRYGMLLADQDPARAVEPLRVALRAMPDDYLAHDALAAALLSAGRAGEAIQECQAELRRMPYHPQAYLTLAYAQARQGAYEKALKAYQEAARLDPSLGGQVANEMGRIRLAQGDLEGAAGDFRRAAASEAGGPAEADALYNLSQALRRGAHPEQAARILEQACAAYQRLLVGAPGSAALHFGLANALVAGNDLPGAAEHFGLAAQAEPGDMEAHLGLVRSLEAAGRLAAAAQAAHGAARTLRTAGAPVQADELERWAVGLEKQARRGAAP